MDVSTAFQNAAAPDAQPQTLARGTTPVRRSPMLHGLLMGVAACLSVGLLLCCLLAVGGVLGPGRPYLNRSIVVLSLACGLFVAVRSWRKQRAPQPAVRGQCTDCGKELLATDERCPLCGHGDSTVSRST